MTEENEIISQLKDQIDELKLQLAESREVLQAIRTGEVDALVVESDSGQQIYTLKDAEHPYRILVEAMNEGAATISANGTFYYCNSHLASLLKVPLSKIINTPMSDFVVPSYLPAFESVLSRTAFGTGRAEIELKSAEGDVIPVLISARTLDREDKQTFSMIITDLSEQKHTEQVIASERFAQTILNQAADVLLVCDNEGIILRSSEKAHKLFGINFDGWHFDKVFDYFFPVTNFVITETEKISPEPVSFSAIIKGEIPSGSEIALVINKHERYRFLINFSPLSEGGKTIGYSVSLTNITELKRAEKKLKESEEKFRLLISGVQDYAIFMINTSGNVTSWNEGAKNITGYSADEVIGKHFSQFYTKEDVNAGTPEYQLQIAESEGRFHDEGLFVRKDGGTFFVSIFITPIKDSNGVLMGYTKIVHDINKRKIAEESLRKNEEHLRLVVENSPDMMFLQDSDLLYTWIANPIEIYKSINVIGKTDCDIPGLKNHEEIMEIKKHSLSNGIEVRSEIKMLINDKISWYDAVLEPRIGPNNEKIGLFGYMRDITDRKTLEQNVIRLRHEQEAFMRHELYNLFTPIKINIAQLRSNFNNATEKQTKILRKINKNVDRIFNYINNIKKVLNFELGKYELDKITYPLDKIIQQNISEMLPVAEQKGVKINFNKDVNNVNYPLDINFLPGVFSNLILNAIEHVAHLDDSTQKTVSIYLSLEEDRYAIRINNKGEPIPPDRLFTFFEKFNSGPEKSKGTGLGTTYAYYVTKAHGGDINVTSNKTDGTTVSLYFPINSQK